MKAQNSDEPKLSFLEELTLFYILIRVANANRKGEKSVFFHLINISDAMQKELEKKRCTVYYNPPTSANSGYSYEVSWS